MNLIYFNVYQNKECIKLLEVLLHSAFIHSNFDDIKIVVFTFLIYKKDIEDVIKNLNLPIQIATIQNTSLTQMEIRSSRFKIFNYYYVQNYTKILFLDLNVLIHSDIGLLFNIDIENDKIYVLEQGTILEERNGKILLKHVLDERNHDYEEMSQKTAFHTDIMLFCQSKENEKLFKDVLKHILDMPEEMQGLENPYIVYNAFINNQYNNQILKNYIFDKEKDNLNILQYFPSSDTSSSVLETIIKTVQEDYLELFRKVDQDVKKEKNNIYVEFPTKIIETIIQNKLSLASEKTLSTVFNICRNFRNNSLSFVECGVGKGGCLALMKYASYDNKIFGFDNFDGMPELSAKDIGFRNHFCPFNDFGKKGDNFSEGVENVEKTFNRLDIAFKNVSLVKGMFEETLAYNKDKIGKIGVLKIDAFRYFSVKQSLNELFNKVIHGGVIIINNYHSRVGVKYALDEFFRCMKLDLELKTDGDDVYFYKGNKEIYKYIEPTNSIDEIKTNPIIRKILNVVFKHNTLGNITFQSNNIVVSNEKTGTYKIMTENIIYVKFDIDFLFIFNTSNTYFISISRNLINGFGSK
jgi:hypothetical protein